MFTLKTTYYYPMTENDFVGGVGGGGMTDFLTILYFS